jgi:superfamily II DNA or RNA helicase
METITIKKYNEVYNRIICDPGVAKEISDHFTFDVPGAKFMPSFKNKVWDGKIRIFNSMSCLLYSGLNDQLEAFCKVRDYTVEYDNIEADTEFSVLEAKEFIEKLSPKHQPRDYQLDSFIHAVRKRKSLLVSPTASGKSLIIYLLTCWYNTKTLIIVPTTSLVHQMASDFEDYGYPKNHIHKIMSGQEKESDHLIYVSTWQSIYKMPKTWFNKFNVVIGDEAHLFKAKSLIKIMTNLDNCKYRFGFTGTLDGTETNKLILQGLFGPVRKVTTTAELMSKKQVANLQIKAIVLKYPEQERKDIVGKDYQTEIDYIVTHSKRNKFIKNLALSLEGNTLLLFQYVDKQGKPLYDLIERSSKDRRVFFISGEIEGEKREEIRKFIEEEKDAIVIASFGTSSTGINIRNLHNIIFASPSKSRVRNLQSIGRGLRLSENKISTTLYDIADDFSIKNKRNHTITHFVERVKIYNEEKFNYKIYNVDLT